jgi:hypothetical protein
MKLSRIYLLLEQRGDSTSIAIHYVSFNIS